MICLSLGDMDFDTLMEHLKYAPLAEIRMDLLQFSSSRYAAMFAQHRNLIATCRSEQSATAYCMAVDYGCAYIDVDMSVAELPSIVAFAKSRRCRVIVSYHNFEDTPSPDALRAIANQLQHHGADVIKMACMAQSQTDVESLLSLYSPALMPTVAIGMGSMALKSRVLSLLHGAPFTYACADGYATAPGQPTYAQLKRFVGE